MKVKSLIRDVVSSPIGEVEIVSDKAGLIKIVFAWEGKKESALNWGYDELIPGHDNDNSSCGSEIATQLQEYFAGTRKEFSVNVSFQNGTEFQRLVWNEMMKVPYGKTITYAELARNIGRPKAARAVGMACNKNPLCIIVPCHRVVGSGGDLTGYAGGLLKKQWLLAHESGI